MNLPATAPTRRGLMTAAAGAGALVAAASWLRPAPPTHSGAQPAPGVPARGGGYRLTEHVRRYYQTTQI